MHLEAKVTTILQVSRLAQNWNAILKFNAYLIQKKRSQLRARAPSVARCGPPDTVLLRRSSHNGLSIGRGGGCGSGVGVRTR
jgi:hypothetical protein